MSMGQIIDLNFTAVVHINVFNLNSFKGLFILILLFFSLHICFSAYFYFMLHATYFRGQHEEILYNYCNAEKKKPEKRELNFDFVP